ncbi:hypothetical protein AALO_G00273570 [Alosa alosa]|uniref:Uncharacterized protein n=1 Tax=Alosa alosa TaxID=278164 RepID=A0AAV6FHK8_9TELE|nr:hypothetical protein AALO_G00273570 [Alosa alosa]
MQTTLALRRKKIISDVLPRRHSLLVRWWPAIMLESQGSSDVNIRRAVALRGLPFYLHEDDATFLKTWDVSQSEFPDIEDLTVELILISTNSANASLCPKKTPVVLD